MFTLLKLETANRHMPTGGVRFPIMISRVITTPKLTRSIPNLLAIGRKIGIVMMKIAFPSRKHPRISMTTTITMAMMPASGGAHAGQGLDDLVGNLLVDGQPAEEAGRRDDEQQADRLPDGGPEDLAADPSSFRSR